MLRLGTKPHANSIRTIRTEVRTGSAAVSSAQTPKVALAGLHLPAKPQITRLNGDLGKEHLCLDALRTGLFNKDLTELLNGRGAKLRINLRGIRGAS